MAWIRSLDAHRPRRPDVNLRQRRPGRLRTDGPTAGLGFVEASDLSGRAARARLGEMADINPADWTKLTARIEDKAARVRATALEAQPGTEHPYPLIADCLRLHLLDPDALTNRQMPTILACWVQVWMRYVIEIESLLPTISTYAVTVRSSISSGGVTDESDDLRDALKALLEKVEQAYNLLRGNQVKLRAIAERVKREDVEGSKEFWALVDSFEADYERICGSDTTDERCLAENREAIAAVQAYSRAEMTYYQRGLLKAIIILANYVDTTREIVNLANQGFVRTAEFARTAYEGWGRAAEELEKNRPGSGGAMNKVCVMLFGEPCAEATSTIAGMVLLVLGIVVFGPPAMRAISKRFERGGGDNRDRHRERPRERPRSERKRERSFIKR